MNFEEQILEAAKSIAAATSALVKAASAAQRELVAQGKVRLPTEKHFTKQVFEIRIFVEANKMSLTMVFNY